jgi:hypothetical protein
MKVFAEVVPYYFTWFLLSAYRIDRETSVYALNFLILVVAIFEM